jgi:hypothetical protein
MCWRTSLAVALSVAACQQTVVLDQRGGDASVGVDSGVPFCEGHPVEPLVEFPEVIVALDRSAGMGARFGDGTVVLNAARDAIGVHAARYQNVVRFGYVEFPGSAPNCSQSAQACCASLPSPPANNFAAFEFALNGCEQSPASCTVAGYQRPTAPALTSSAQVFLGRSDLVQRYVLLVTNGQPDCGLSQNSACTDAQNAANQLADNLQVSTVVVAPGQLAPDDVDCLQRIAAFGGADIPPYFRPAANAGELAAELGDVIRTMARGACHLDVTTRIQEQDRVLLRWKEMPIPRNRNDGWQLINNGYEIELHGEWCERFIDGAPTDITLFTDCDPQR